MIKLSTILNMMIDGEYEHCYIGAESNEWDKTLKYSIHWNHHDLPLNCVDFYEHMIISERTFKMLQVKYGVMAEGGQVDANNNFAVKLEFKL